MTQFEPAKGGAPLASTIRASAAFPSVAFDQYESTLAPARERFAKEAFLDHLLSSRITDEVLELFLLNFCARGPTMTEPVEDWIRRAGERCLAMGLSDLGRALVAHARHESGHHLLMITDAHALAERINARRKEPIAVEAILNALPTPGATRYRELHEDVIASDAPFCQIAIEYEIEQFAISLGPTMIARCKSRLGPDIVDSLSFMTEHVALDVGHTHMNAREISRLLKQHPAFVSPLIAAGEGALSAYAEFMRDCFIAAEAQKEGLV